MKPNWHLEIKWSTCWKVMDQTNIGNLVKGIYPCFAEIGQNRHFEVVITLVQSIVNIYRPLQMTAMEGRNRLEGFRGHMEHFLASYEPIKIGHFHVFQKY